MDFIKWLEDRRAEVESDINRLEQRKLYVVSALPAGQAEDKTSDYLKKLYSTLREFERAIASAKEYGLGKV